MKTNKNHMGIGLLLAALGVLGAFLIPETPNRAKSGDEGLETPGRGGEAPKVKRRALKREVVADKPALLRIQAFLEGSRPAAGTLFWVESPTPPFPDKLLATPLRPAEPMKLQKKDYSGTVEILPEDGCWTWLRMTHIEKGKAPLSTYRLVPPFRGEKSLIVTFQPSRRALDVFLLDPDFTPASRGTIRLWFTPIEEVSPPKILRTAKVGQGGFARFEDLPPGGYFAACSGAKPGDSPPQVKRILLPAKIPQLEEVVVLVKKETMYPMTLVLQVALGPPRNGGGYESDPCLILVRTTRRSGEIFPIRRNLQNGRNELKFALPEGIYEIRILPLGSLEIPEASRRIYVSPNLKNRYEVYAKRPPREETLDLEGIPDHLGPFYVYPRFEGPNRLLDDRPGIYFFGTFPWAKPNCYLRIPGDPFRVVAVSKFGTWLSRDLLQGERTAPGRRISVAMIEGTWLDLRWFTDKRPEAGASFHLEVQTSGRTERHAIRPYLLDEGGVTLPVIGCAVVVPRGPAFLRCFREGDETPLWERKVKAARNRQTLVVKN